MKPVLTCCGVLLLLGLSIRSSYAAEAHLKLVDLREGDLLFEQSTSSQAAIIQRATHSKWTHVAIALQRTPGEPIFAIEAAGPVGFASIRDLIARSRDGRLIVKRLRDQEHILTSKNIAALRSFLLKQQGKPYDSLFLWDDESMYCSELAWKSFKSACDIELGNIGQWSELDLQSPSVIATIRERYARRNQPLDMDKLRHGKIITPAAIYNCSLLEEVGVLETSR